MPKGIFITATDTEIGKTAISAALGLALKDKCLDIAYMKPFSAGGKHSEDVSLLFKTLKLKDPLPLINPYHFHSPLAPYPASQIEKRKIYMPKVIYSFQKLKKRHAYTIVEGVGGIMVPITKKYFVLDLIKDMKLPAILIARAGLGTINHTLSSIELLKKKHADVKAIILNNYSGNDLAEKTNVKVIEELSGIKVLTLKHYKDNVIENLAQELKTKLWQI